MRNHFIMTVAGIMFLVSCVQSPGIVLKSASLAGDTVLVDGNVIPDYDNEFADTIVVAPDGSFKYRLPVDVPAVVRFTPLSGGEPLWLYVAPDEFIEVSADKAGDGKVSFEIVTECLSKGIARFMDEMGPVSESVRSAWAAANAAYSEGTPKEVADSLFNMYDRALAACDSFVTDYFLKNAGSPEAPYVFLSVPLDSVESFVSLLEEKGRTSILKPFVEDRISEFRAARLKKASAGNIKIGAVAPYFVLKDVEGKDLALSSLRGRTVVLDFWGTWCGSCMKGIPGLREAVRKYGDRITVLGIACHDSEKAWREALAEYGMQEWLNVREPEELDMAVRPSVLYNVTGFPTKIVLDKDGKIVNITVGEDPCFYEELDKILSE